MEEIIQSLENRYQEHVSESLPSMFMYQLGKYNFEVQNIIL